MVNWMDPAVLLGLAIGLSFQLASVVTAISAARYNGAHYTAAGRSRELRTVFVLNGVLGFLAVPIGLTVSLLYWVRVRPALARKRRNDRAVSDADWVENGRLRYAETIGRLPGGPEDAVEAGDEHRRAGDWAAALWSDQEALERLHAAYVRDAMTGRTPKPEDSRILMPMLHTLDTARRLRRAEPAAAFARQAAPRLDEIARACRDAGHDPSPYLTGVDRLTAPSRS